jgi:hypothetical protein
MPAPTATIRTGGSPLSKILGFENSTGYISSTDSLMGCVPLEMNSEVYADIKRAKEHAEYLAGVKAREWGYQGGVGEVRDQAEIVCSERQQPIPPHSEQLEEEDINEQTPANDVSSMPLQSSPTPQPKPKHPFKDQQKVSFSPNIADEPESTLYRKVVTRVGGRGDWGAPAC